MPSVNEEFDNFFKKYDAHVSYRDVLPNESAPYKLELMKFLKNFSSIDLTRISFPINYNEPLSTTQKTSEIIKFCSLLDRAFEQDDVIDKLAALVAFRSACCSLTPAERNRKPFNAFLGETFEYIDADNKLLVISEQVSHHPPITVLHAQSKTWELQLEYKSSLKFLITKIKMMMEGKMMIKSKINKEVYVITLPGLILNNITSSKFYMHFEGDSCIQLFNSKARAELHYRRLKNPDSKNNVTGVLYDEEGIERAKIEGNYYKEIHIIKKDCDDKSLLWQNEAGSIMHDYYGFTKFTCRLNDPSFETKCPTDSRHRKDIRLYENGRVDAAEREKKRLESEQRKAIQNLVSTNKTYTPKWFHKSFVTELNQESYQYTGEYWNTKLEDKFTPGLITSTKVSC